MAYEGSPAANLNKGYANQEKSDLMNDNPVARDASGGRPWISRHFRSSMGGSPLSKHSEAQEKGLNPGLVSAIHMHDDFTKKNNIKHK